MGNSDPVSPHAYWLPVPLILPVQPIVAVAAISDVGMKGQKIGGGAGLGDSEIEVKAGKRGMDDTGRGEKWRVTRMEMCKGYRGELSVLYTETKVTICVH